MHLRSRPGAPVALIAAFGATEAAVAPMGPRHGVIEPAPVRAGSYFSDEDVQRARTAAASGGGAR